MTRPPPARAATAAAASAARRRPSSLRSAVCAKPVVSPTTTRMPAPRSRPVTRSSTRRSSSTAAVERTSSANTSAKSPPLRKAACSVRRMTESSIMGTPPEGDAWVRTVNLGPTVTVDGDRRAPHCTAGRGPVRGPLPDAVGRPHRAVLWWGPVPTEPGLRAEITLVVTGADTAVAARSGDVPVLATPRLLALFEEASVAARRRPAGGGQDHGRHARPARPPGPHRPWAGPCGPRRSSRKSKGPA